MKKKSQEGAENSDPSLIIDGKSVEPVFVAQPKTTLVERIKGQDSPNRVMKAYVLLEEENDKLRAAIDTLTLRHSEVIVEREQITARRNELIELHESLRERFQAQTNSGLAARIQEILYPGGDTEHEWGADELNDISALVMANATVGGISASVKGEIDRHVKHGCPCGDFVTAVLDNDLKEAFGRADDKNTATMREIVTYIYNHVPIGCQGSKLKRQAWQAHGGREGVVAEHQEKGNVD